MKRKNNKKRKIEEYVMQIFIYFSFFKLYTYEGSGFRLANIAIISNLANFNLGHHHDQCAIY